MGPVNLILLALGAASAASGLAWHYRLYRAKINTITDDYMFANAMDWMEPR